ncbi:cation-transporting P-type ATPase [Streptomyces axinellae]|uniref:Cation-transporting P-type ATPase N-terminal domain-containing protein n=1 Tax=Streptomyces axinellae TaxID=552788 RepID=A0ABN3PMM9_9ACTN
MDTTPPAGPAGEEDVDPREPLPRLRAELRTSSRGLSSREAERRRAVHGPNEVRREQRNRLGQEAVQQLVHPLALLLWGAAALAFVAGTAVLGFAIVAVVLLNAAFALLQERQAERAVEALAGYLPDRTTVVRDGAEKTVEARDLVPGDVIVLAEGDKVPADGRLVEGALEVDLSMLTGESAPVERTTGEAPAGLPTLREPNLVFSGTACLGGRARAIVFATGGRTELGRIAALSQHTRREESPLEHQVKRVAWLIAMVATGMGAAFLVVGSATGLPLRDALTFAIGLLVANVPEGLLPIITLALAVGVRVLARRGAVVKRLSAVETLGSTHVICTDKTGTLTKNRMRLRSVWTPDGGARGQEEFPTAGEDARELARAMTECSSVGLDEHGQWAGDPTETALVEGAGLLGETPDPRARDERRRAVFRFDPRLRLMSVVAMDGDRLVISVKGAPEAVLSRLQDDECAARAQAAGEEMAGAGLRVLAVATRELAAGTPAPIDRGDAERGLRLLGLVGLYDPPRDEVPDAVRRCHEAGLRVHIVTGDNGATAAAVAREVGIGEPELRVVPAAESVPDHELDELLTQPCEIVFARSSPETKLRVADALRAQGQIVAMTGDGVNDAPALHRAHIGVAMGVGGTDVARGGPRPAAHLPVPDLGIRRVPPGAAEATREHPCGTTAAGARA